MREITEEELQSVDLFQEIPLDDRSRFVRFYGEEGTVLIDSDQYDLKFQVRDQAKDQTCKVTFSMDARTTTEHDVIVHVPLGSPDYTEFVIDNEIHRIKIGAPTRELWIDGKWYNLYFDGEPITINIANRNRDVFFEKLLQIDIPIVDIGKVARKDLCLGI